VGLVTGRMEAVVATFFSGPLTNRVIVPPKK
jgi:hypothetical protein